MFNRIRFGSSVFQRQRRLVQLKPVLGLVQNFMDVVQARLGDGVCVLPLQTKNKVKHQFVCEIGNTFFASF